MKIKYGALSIRRMNSIQEADYYIQIWGIVQSSTACQQTFQEKPLARDENLGNLSYCGQSQSLLLPRHFQVLIIVGESTVNRASRMGPTSRTSWGIFRFQGPYCLITRNES